MRHLDPCAYSLPPGGTSLVSKVLSILLWGGGGVGGAVGLLSSLFNLVTLSPTAPTLILTAQIPIISAASPVAPGSLLVESGLGIRVLVTLLT